MDPSIPDAKQTQLPTRRTAKQWHETGQQLQQLYELPLYRLPAELVVNVLHHVDLEDYPSFIIAAMPLLRRCGIVQDMSTLRLKRLLLGSRTAGTFNKPLQPVNVYAMLKRLRGGFERLPPELCAQIVRKLGPLDRVNLTLSCFRFSDEDIETLIHEKV